jgi:hypothetical protein
MTPDHPRWAEFLERLEGPEGCNFHEDEDGEEYWYCANDAGFNPTTPELVHVFSRAVLLKMGLSQEAIAASIEYFREHGGYCDCEVIWNVENSTEAEAAGAFNCVDCGKSTHGEYYSVKPRCGPRPGWRLTGACSASPTSSGAAVTRRAPPEFF